MYRWGRKAEQTCVPQLWRATEQEHIKRQCQYELHLGRSLAQSLLARIQEILEMKKPDMQVLFQHLPKEEAKPQADKGIRAWALHCTDPLCRTSTEQESISEFRDVSPVVAT